MKRTVFLLCAMMAVTSVFAQTTQRTITVNDVTFNMILVEGGRFNMGGTAEQYNTEDDAFLIP